MPLIEYVCMSGHATERLVQRRDMVDVPDYIRCDECAGPAMRQVFGLVANAMGRGLPDDVPLAHLHEAALEAEYQHERTDDPTVKANYPDRVWHAAKVRSEAQMLAGAKQWSPRRAWNAAEVG